MKKRYVSVQAEFMIPEGVDIETIIRQINIEYKVDRVAQKIEDEPTLFFIKEIKENEKSKQN